MRHAICGRIGVTMAAVLVAGSVAQAVINIETVPVGNAGNAKDPASGSLYGVSAA
ncbi:MAG: hypothetical protein IT447_16400 [Phycisphaerales bacterium]|jgi:hypothetical protein|nr:hypothetical protein [Phycisphaerales bacterium]